MKVLDKCYNMFRTPLNEDCRGRLEKYINNPNPTPDDWDDISGIIIDAENTVWNVMLEFDPTFPRLGRRYNTEFSPWKVITEWEKIPSGFTVARALQEHWKKRNPSERCYSGFRMEEK